MSENIGNQRDHINIHQSNEFIDPYLRMSLKSSQAQQSATPSEKFFQNKIDLSASLKVQQQTYHNKHNSQGNGHMLSKGNQQILPNQLIGADKFESPHNRQNFGIQSNSIEQIMNHQSQTGVGSFNSNDNYIANNLPSKQSNPKNLHQSNPSQVNSGNIAPTKMPEPRKSSSKVIAQYEDGTMLAGSPILGSIDNNKKSSFVGGQQPNYGNNTMKQSRMSIHHNYNQSPNNSNMASHEDFHHSHAPLQLNTLYQSQQSPLSGPVHQYNTSNMHHQVPHKRKNSNESKQLPPLDPKSSNNLAQYNIQSSMKGTGGSNKKRGLAEHHYSGSQNSLNVQEGSPHKGSSKFKPLQQNPNSSMGSMTRQHQSDNLLNKKFMPERHPQTSSNLTQFHESQTLSLERKNSNNIDLNKYQIKNNAGLANLIVQEQNLKSSGGAQNYGKKTRSPYNVNQTAELLMNHEKRNNSQMNTKQKKLKQVLQSYQISPMSPSKGDGRLNVIDYTSAPVQQMITSHSGRPYQEDQINQMENLRPNIRKQFSLTQMGVASQPIQNGPKHSILELGQQNQSQNNLQKPSQFQKSSSKNIQISTSKQYQQSSSKIRKMMNKKQSEKPDSKALKLNLSNILKTNDSNHSVDVHQNMDGMLTAKSNFQKQKSKNKKITLNIKKVPQLSSFKKGQLAQTLSNGNPPVITTDDRRFLKYQGGSSNTLNNLEFTSARTIGKKDSPTKNRIGLNTQNPSLTRQSENIKNKQSVDYQNSLSRYTPTIVIETANTRSNHMSYQGNIESITIQDNQTPESAQYFDYLIEQLDTNSQNVSDVMHRVCDRLNSEKKSSLASLIQKINQNLMNQINTHQKSLQIQNVSPSAYQILKEDNEKQSQIINSQKDQIKRLEDNRQNQQREIDKLKQQLQEKEIELSMMSGRRNQDKSNQIIKQELQSLYEQTKEQEKEIKRLKKEVKLYQEREKDYLSVLKNTSEVSKMAIEQRTGGNQHHGSFNSSQKQTSDSKKSPQPPPIRNIPKLNLQKAMQVNMMMSKVVAPIDQFDLVQNTHHIPAESSKRGAYIHFKSGLNGGPSMTGGTNSSLGMTISQTQQNDEGTVQNRDFYMRTNQNTSLDQDQIEEELKDNMDNQLEVHDQGHQQQRKSYVINKKRSTLKSKKHTEKNLEQLTGLGGLDLKKLNKIQCFQDEFMDRYEEFSLSWREAIEKQRRF